MRILLILLAAFLFFPPTLLGQLEDPVALDPAGIFDGDSILEVELTFSYKQVIRKKFKEGKRPGKVTITWPDGHSLSSEIQVRPRGEFRKRYCAFPPLRLEFDSDTITGPFSGTPDIKLVTHCKKQKVFREFILEEYLAYRIYQQLTPYSFKVRLVNITYRDFNGKKMGFESMGFFIEPIDLLAARVKGIEIEPERTYQKDLNREQVTLMQLFEFMAGNTDWYLGNLHNVKLIQLADVTVKPIPVPYDFDYSGLVNTMYAIPDPKLGIETVRQRKFNGYCREPEEWEAAFEHFRSKKADILSLINEFELLDHYDRKQAVKYLEEFYEIIDSPTLSKRMIFNECTRTVD